MLIIKDGQGNVEPLIDYKAAEIDEQVNGDFSFSFTCFFTEKNQYSYPLVLEENFIEVDGQEYRIKQMKDRTIGLPMKEVKAFHVFFDLIDDRRDEIIGGNKTLDEIADFILGGTGWTYENIDVTETKLLFNFGDKNLVQLIYDLCDIFQCEFDLQGRHIIFKKEVGEDTDFQFRYKHNIKTLSRSVDTTKLTTYVKGYGNGFELEYTSPNASIFGIREAEPIRDEEEADPDRLLEKMKQSIVDEPNVSIEVEAILLEQMGYTAKKGDRVYLIYEPLGIDFKARVMGIKTNLLNKKLSKVTIANFKPSMMDYVTQLQKDVVKVEKDAIINRSRITQTDERITLEVERINGSVSENRSLIEQTAEQIRLEVTSINNQTKTDLRTEISQTAESVTISANSYTDSKASGVLTDAKGYTDREVGTVTSRVAEAEASITLLSNEISTKVAQTVYETGITETRSYAASQATAAQTNAVTAANAYTDGQITTIDERVTSAESSITQLANSITSKVEQTVYESGISQTRTYAEQQAGTAKSEAISAAALDATSKANQAKTDANGYADSQISPVVTRLTTAESSITQLSNDITLKVTTSTYESDKQLTQNDIASLENRVSDTESELSVQAGEISSKVAKTDYTGNTIASLINQTATTIKLQASKINLTGAVTVLSDITGDLGTITAGTINISNDIKVGRTLTLGNGWSDAYDRHILFNGNASIRSAGDTLHVDALGGMDFDTFAYFNSNVTFTRTVNFSGATVQGLNLTAKFG